MAPHGSRDETSDDLISAFHVGWMRQISKQLAELRSGQIELRTGQEISRAQTDRHLVLTGQVLEAVRTVTPAAPPLSSYGRMKSLWGSLKEVLSGFALLHKAYVAWRAVSLPAAGYTLAKFLGWL